jgi:integrase
MLRVGLHDFRHTCIRRWATEGIPQQAIMAAAGHHLIEQNNDYVNMKDDHLRAAFKLFTPRLHGKPVENQCVASY